MTSRFFMIGILSLTLFTGRVKAGPEGIEAQQAEWNRLQAVQDSLRLHRSRLTAELERLSVRIDSLKAEREGTRAGGALEEALRRSVGLVGRVEAVDRELEGVYRVLKALREQFREAYDREIGALIGRLGETPDRALIRQLTALQEAREALAQEGSDKPEANLLVIREDDGLDEIRQKADLMEDMAARLRAEVQATERRLRRLREERRLRARFTAFARETTLFDENLPEGRAIAPGEKQTAVPYAPREDVAAETEQSVADAARGDVAAGTEPLSEASVPEGVVVGREVSPGSAQGLPVDLGAGGLAVEIERLKAHRTALRARDRALREQVATFRKRIQQMLEERK